jgi:hypothetical protein
VFISTKDVRIHRSKASARLVICAPARRSRVPR